MTNENFNKASAIKNDIYHIKTIIGDEITSIKNAEVKKIFKDALNKSIDLLEKEFKNL